MVNCDHDHLVDQTQIQRNHDSIQSSIEVLGWSLIVFKNIFLKKHFFHGMLQIKHVPEVEVFVQIDEWDQRFDHVEDHPLKHHSRQEHDLQHVVELDRLVYQSEHGLFDASV